MPIKPFYTRPTVPTWYIDEIPKESQVSLSTSRKRRKIMQILICPQLPYKTLVIPKLSTPQISNWNPQSVSVSAQS